MGDRPECGFDGSGIQKGIGSLEKEAIPTPGEAAKKKYWKEQVDLSEIETEKIKRHASDMLGRNSNMWSRQLGELP